MATLPEKYHEPVSIAVVAASAVGPAGILLPVFDAAGIGVIWSTMVGAIAKGSAQEVSGAVVGKVVAAALGGVAGYSLGSKVLSWTLIAALPGAGVPTAMVANAALN